MPGGDRTGPLGRGQMTGRRAGFCRGYSDPGWYSAGRLHGWLYRTGYGGRGWRSRHHFAGLSDVLHFGIREALDRMTPETEEEVLKEQAEYLKSELERVDSRLREISEKEPE